MVSSSSSTTLTYAPSVAPMALLHMRVCTLPELPPHSIGAAWVTEPPHHTHVRARKQAKIARNATYLPEIAEREGARKRLCCPRCCGRRLCRSASNSHVTCGATRTAEALPCSRVQASEPFSFRHPYVSKLVLEYAARHCFAAPPLAYPTPTTVCACAISCLATGLTEGLGARLYVAGWTHEETIESLVRKAGFNGVLTIKLKQSIKVTRYQSSLCTMRYEQYLVAVGGRAA